MAMEKMNVSNSPLSGLSDEDLSHLIECGKDFACLFGILKCDSKKAPSVLQHTLLPSLYPEEQFKKAVSMQTLYNELYHLVSLDCDFLSTVLKPALTQDSYLASLWRIFQNERILGPLQPIKLALSRSDYMLHSTNPTQRHVIKQVEYNLIASSFGGIMPRLVETHQLMLSLARRSCSIPDCPSATGFAKGFNLAHIEYVNFLHASSIPVTKSPVILMVVSDVETNIFDQRSIELAVGQLNPDIRMLRRTFKQLSQSAGRVSIDCYSRLFVDGMEVALVYYRTGYAPEHYDVFDWDTRALLERTLAIKCPSIDTMITNVKLVQTALAQPGVLERFFNGRFEEICQLTSTFAKQNFISPDYKFTSEAEVNSLISDCLLHPQDFVLKPQREGGGNNIFGDDIPKKLKIVLGRPEANSYILMERFRPPIVENCVVALNYPPPLRRPMISELGIFGVLLSKGEEIIENYHAGYLLRSKFVGVDEGGVVTGFSSLDTPCLI